MAVPPLRRAGSMRHVSNFSEVSRRRVLVGGLLLAAGVAARPAPTTSWLDDAGRPSGLADEAIALLLDASTHGLDPAEYHVDSLADLATSIKQAACGWRTLSRWRNGR